MSWFTNYVKSSVGAKHVMAVTGVALVGFLLIHMVGNLQVFAGQDALNSYAEWLHSKPAMVWGARAGLLLCFVIHIASSIRLVVLNKASKPIKYAVYKPSRSPFYARVMPWSGMIVLAFLVFHLLHLTFGTVFPDHAALVDEQNRHDVYRMVVLGFQNAAIAGSYIVAMALLCMHLAHGVTSMFQSLGIAHPKYDGLIAKAGPLFALLIFIGNIAMPAAVLAGIIKLPGA